MTFDELQAKAVNIEIDIMEKEELAEEHKEITSDLKMILIRLNFGDFSFKTADLSLFRRIAKKHNCKVKFLAFRNGDHLSVDLWFHPKEEKGREDL